MLFQTSTVITWLQPKIKTVSIVPIYYTIIPFDMIETSQRHLDCNKVLNFFPKFLYPLPLIVCLYLLLNINVHCLSLPFDE